MVGYGKGQGSFIIVGIGSVENSFSGLPVGRWQVKLKPGMNLLERDYQDNQLIALTNYFPKI